MKKTNKEDQIKKIEDMIKASEKELVELDEQVTELEDLIKKEKEEKAKTKQIETDEFKKTMQKEIEASGMEEMKRLEYAIEIYGIEHVKKRTEERIEARKRAQENRECARRFLNSDALALNIKYKTPLCGSYLIYSLVRNLPMDLQLAILGEFEKADKLLKAKITDK